MTNEEEQDLDMDTMPKAEMEEMDRNLAQIFLYYKEQRALRKLKVKTAGIDSELMEYRNRFVKKKYIYIYIYMCVCVCVCVCVCL